MATLGKFTVCSPCNLSMLEFSYVPFWIRGKDFGSDFPVPGHCLPSTFHNE